MARVYQFVVLLFCVVSVAVIAAELSEEEPLAKENTGSESTEKTPPENEESPTANPQEAPQTESEESGELHAEGSVCTYCTYCKFCELCEKDCPCKKSKSKPNCHMCKYCKYCYLCSAVCDTICQPGGFIDTVSSTIWNSLPKFDSKMKDSVDKDINSVKDWIKEYL